MKYKIAVVGDLETVTGFALAGATYLHVHHNRHETLQKLRAFLSNPRVGFVLITSRVWEELSEELEPLLKMKDLLPMVLVIPDRKGYYPAGIDELEKLVRRTAGVEVVLG
jgi:vacuolar-type H+-ATPase subunit F/Vma7